MSSISPEVFNRIQTLYAQLLAAAAVANQTTVNSNCGIAIGTILGDLNSNCNIKISNICRSEGDNLALLDLAVSKVISLYNDVDVDLISTYNALRQDCIAQSSITQSITIQDINLGICKPKFLTNFLFVNSGEAVSNCVVTGLLNLSNNSEVIPSVSSLEEFIDNNFIWLISGLAFTGIIFIGLLFLNRETVRITWRKT